MEDDCPICGDVRTFKSAFRVPYPDLSPTRGQYGWPFRSKPDVSNWAFFRCQECEVTVPLPHPSKAEVEGGYASSVEATDWEMEHYVDVSAPQKQGEAEHVDRLARLNGGVGSLLEVGPAAGWLLAAARDRGWRVKGVEAAPKFQRFAQQTLGLDVELGTVETVDLSKDGPFDIIVLRDVLEHLHDPVETLRRLAAVLAPNGSIVIETPNIASAAARFYGLRWRQMIVSHIFYWSPKSLRLCVARAGLRVVQISEPRYWDPDSSLQRRRRLIEIAKFAARCVAATYVLPARRWPVLEAVPSALTRGRLSHAEVVFKAGGQPVLGDVLLCVAEH